MQIFDGPGGKPFLSPLSLRLLSQLLLPPCPVQDLLRRLVISLGHGSSLLVVLSAYLPYVPYTCSPTGLKHKCTPAAPCRGSLLPVL